MSTHTPLTEDDYSFIWNSAERVGFQADLLKQAAMRLFVGGQDDLASLLLNAATAITGEAADIQSTLYDAWEAGGGLQSENKPMGEGA